MDRQQLLRRLEKAWQDFRQSYEGLSEDAMNQAGVAGAWSVRDIIAHVTTWEEEALKHLPAILNGQRSPRYSVRYGGIDAFNALMTAQKAGFSLPELFTHQDQVHGRLVRFLEQAPEPQLVHETPFRRRIRLDTYGHYPKHADAIRRWRRATECG